MHKLDKIIDSTFYLFYSYTRKHVLKTKDEQATLQFWTTEYFLSNQMTTESGLDTIQSYI